MTLYKKLENSPLLGTYKALNTAWRQEVLRSLDIRWDGFQLLQGGLGQEILVSAELYQIADAVPKHSSVVNDFGGNLPTRSGSYQRLLGALAPEIELGLRGLLQSDYPAWVRYRNGDCSGRSQDKLFDAWSEAVLSPERGRMARNLFRSMVADALHNARDMIARDDHYETCVMPSGKIRQVPRYSCSMEQAKRARYSRGGHQIRFDSRDTCRMAPDPILGEADCRVEQIFPALNDGIWNPIERRALSARITVDGVVHGRTVLAATPAGWYDDDVVQRAWGADRDEEVWDAASTTGRWRSFFADHGSLARYVSHLVLVAGYDLTVTIHAGYSSEEYSEILPTLTRGIWPLYGAKLAAVSKIKPRHNPDGSVSVRLQQTGEHPQCWGRFVSVTGLLAASCAR